jgi:hypothetical protein
MIGQGVVMGARPGRLVGRPPGTVGKGVVARACVRRADRRATAAGDAAACAWPVWLRWPAVKDSEMIGQQQSRGRTAAEGASEFKPAACGCKRCRQLPAAAASRPALPYSPAAEAVVVAAKTLRLEGSGAKPAV